MKPASLLLAAERPRAQAGPRGAVLVAAGALALLIPAFANSYPFLFFDTIHYESVGAKIVSLLTSWAHASGPAAPAIAGPAPGAPTGADPYAMAGYVGARSPYYGLFLYLLNAACAGWGPAAAQALAGSWLIWLCVRLIGRGAAVFAAVIAALTALTALPWVGAFLMPDVFGGYAILAIGAIAFYWERLTRADRAGCGFIVLAAMSFHTINLLLMAGAALICAARLIFPQRRAPARTLALLAAALAVTFAANALYPAASRLAGKPVRTPPLLTARFVADGPGRAYLRAACARGVRYALCAFKDSPLASGDAILWSLDPRQGVYLVSPPDVQQALIEEQPRFVLGVVTHEPLAQVWASLKNWGAQLVSFSLNDFASPAANWRAAAPAMDRALAPFLATPAARGAFPFAPFSTVQAGVLALALGFLAVWLLRPASGADERALRGFALFALALIVLNAGIAGALSGVFNRYQARVIWIAPLLALLAAGARTPERSR